MTVNENTLPQAGRLPLPCAPERVDEFLSEPTTGALDAISSAPGSILVLGAGGKMGLHLSLMLNRALIRLRRRERVIAVSRFGSLHDREVFSRHGIDTLTCDLTDPAALARLPEASTIFFLAGMKFGTAAAPELLKKFNAEMPLLVAERFRRARIVAFSTGCVYPFVPVDSGGATEAVPVAPVGDYAASCVQREAAFSAASLRHGTSVTLVRLNYAVEFRYGLLVDIAQKVRRGEPVDVSTGYVNAIWQRDAIAHSIQSLALAAAPAAPVNITGPDTLSVRALAHRFGELLVPAQPVQIAGTEAPTAWLNNAARSHRLFGAPAVSTDEMTTWIAAWLQQGGETWGKPTGFERRDGRF